MSFYTAGLMKEVKPTKPFCQACKLNRQCSSPKLAVEGQGKNGIMIITDYPSASEDREGERLCGDSGLLMRDYLNADPDRDCWIVSAVNCRPESDDGPTDKEIENCRPMMDSLIREKKPKVILVFGQVALKAFLKGKWKDKPGSIDTWVGHEIPDRTTGAWVMFLNSPTTIIKSGSKVLKLLFSQMLERGVSLADKPLPDQTDEKRFVKVLNSDMAVPYLEALIKKQPAMIAIDYETTGLKPHAKGHRIVCASIATGPRAAVAFPVDDKTAPLLCRILADERISKTAQNLKFEEMWSRVTLNTPVKGWKWDTLLVSHILDNRRRTTGLKFQTYVNFGMGDYSSSIEPLLSADKANDKNKLAGKLSPAVFHDLMTYCGLDALYTFKLQRIQSRKVKKAGKNLQAAVDLFHEGALALADMEEAGIRVDEKYCRRESKRLKNTVNEIRERLMKEKDVKIWRERYGAKFNLDSPLQLNTLLYKIKKLKPTKTTAKDNASVDAEVLEKLSKKLPWLKDLIALRKLNKNLSTYLGGIINESVDGIMHPFFNLHIPVSYRSSANAPSTQNYPKRDPEAQNVIRSAIIPRPGNRILEADFSGVEVCVSACIHHDPVMIKYIEDPTTDMHRDTAMALFKIKAKDVTKDARFIAKNNFVFAQFYGDWYKSCAEGLWSSMKEMNVQALGQSMREHLASIGIKTLNSFIDQVKKVEDYFWNVRFKVYTKWKKKVLRQYEKVGFFEMVTGFRCTAPMNQRQLWNYGIQGPAFHCLLWSYIQLNKERKRRGWKTKIIFQIHDSLGMDIPPDEYDEVREVAKRIMTVDIRKAWPWIIVPLKIEFEAGEIDEPWSKIKGED